MKELCNILLESANGMLCCVKKGDAVYYRRCRDLYDDWHRRAESEQCDFNNRTCRRAKKLYEKATKMYEEKFMRFSEIREWKDG